MALIKKILSDELSKFTDGESISFDKFPTDISEASEFWSNAVNTYGKTIAPPSTTADKAKKDMKDMLATMNDTNGAVIFPLAILTYATSLSAGFPPVFTGVPPVTPLAPLLNPIYTLGFAGAKSGEIVEALSTIIDSWFKTGTAINIATGVTITWL